jgi:hypothetical protein
MPCETDLYFIVEDNRREVACMQKAEIAADPVDLGPSRPATRCSTISGVSANDCYRETAHDRLHRGVGRYPISRGVRPPR